MTTTEGKLLDCSKLEIKQRFVSDEGFQLEVVSTPHLCGSNHCQCGCAEHGESHGGFICFRAVIVGSGKRGVCHLDLDGKVELA